MRRTLGLVALVPLLLLGCSSHKDTRELMVPQSRLIYNGGTFGIFTFCDRGNRVYVTDTGLAKVVANGCPNGEP